MKNHSRLGSDPLSQPAQGSILGEALAGAFYASPPSQYAPRFPAELLDALDEPVVLHLPDGTALFANRSFRELAELAPDAPLPSLATLLAPPDTSPDESTGEFADWTHAVLNVAESGRSVLRRTCAATGPGQAGRLLLTSVRSETRDRAAPALAGFLDSALPSFDDLENARLFDRLSASRERFMIAAMGLGDHFGALTWTAATLSAAANGCVADLREAHGLPAGALCASVSRHSLRMGRAEAAVALFLAFVLLDLGLEDSSRCAAPGSLRLDMKEAQGDLLLSITDNAGLLPDSLSLSDRKNGALRAVAGICATCGGMLTLAHGDRARLLSLRLPSGPRQNSARGASNE